MQSNVQTNHRPILFLDVDGPLNPTWTEPPEGYTAYRTMPSGLPSSLKPLTVYLNPAHGPALQALPYDLVWATTWYEDANEWIGRPLGLPALPYVEVPHETGRRTLADRLWLSTKTQAVTKYANGRPFAWVDDEITALDKRWVRERYAAPALLHAVNVFSGLGPDDFSALAAWARDLPLHGSKR